MKRREGLKRDEITAVWQIAQKFLGGAVTWPLPAVTNICKQHHLEFILYTHELFTQRPCDNLI